MSYSIFIQKFESGEPSAFEFDELANIISPFGEIIETDYGLEINTTKDLFEFGSLGKDKSNIDMISFHRPIINTELKELIFGILQINGTCYFDQELGYLQTRTPNMNEFPIALIENTTSGIELIYSVKQIWPQ